MEPLSQYTNPSIVPLPTICRIDCGAVAPCGRDCGWEGAECPCGPGAVILRLGGGADCGTDWAATLPQAKDIAQTSSRREALSGIRILGADPGRPSGVSFIARLLRKAFVAISCD